MGPFLEKLIWASLLFGLRPLLTMQVGFSFLPTFFWWCTPLVLFLFLLCEPLTSGSSG